MRTMTEEIEIPLGAFDSETVAWTYTIPEGFTAKIEDGKIIVEKMEGDDERIREWIIGFLKNEIDDNELTSWGVEKAKKAIAWLEKQKEHDMLNSTQLIAKWKEEKAILKEKDLRGHPWRLAYNAFMDGFCYGLHVKQKEQKTAEYNQEYREEDLQTRVAFYTYKDEPTVLYLSNLFVEEASRGAHFGTRILRGAERLAEVIGASTIRLKVKQDSPANTWYRKHGYGYMTFEDGYDWLEKNLEYMKPNKQEWSEEDTFMLTAIIQTLERFGGRGTTGMQIDWLKSLHPQPKQEWSEEDERYLNQFEYALKSNSLMTRNLIDWALEHIKPQLHWKPSEEQIRELKYAISGCSFETDVLDSLYSDLKKL